MTKPSSSGSTTSTRRHLLQGAGALALATGMNTGVGRTAKAQSATKVTFAFAPDDSGAIQGLIDGFNAAHEGKIEVVWRKMDRLSDGFFRDLQSDFRAGADDIDLFGADVVWTAELAARDQIVSLTSLIDQAYPDGTFLNAALRSTRYRNRNWAVPWYSDAGMLFYRKDLLAEAGFDAPPATWDELASMAGKIQEEAGIAHGFVFQGDSYEGGVTNALEFIWSAGGKPWTQQTAVAGALGMGQSVRDPNVITLNSKATAAGLDRARAFIADGIAPLAVADMREQESLAAFMAGDAVFMRNWPFAYGIMTSDESAIAKDQIGIAPIPTLEDGGRSFSCLGGWNLAISASSPKREAAFAFIRFATEPAQQQAMARTGGFLPSLAGLYDDEALKADVPLIDLGKTAVQNARSRPASPIYSLLSPRLALMFERVLQGDITGSEAARLAETELMRIVRRHA